MSDANLYQLSEGELRAWRMQRWRARTDLTYLAKEVLGYKDVIGPQRFPFMNRLQKFPVPTLRQFEDNDRIVNGRWRYTPITPMYDLPGGRRVLILDPRGFLKTTINAQSHTIQWILNYPDIAMMIIQATSDKAISILGEIKRHFQANETFRALFPEHCPKKRPWDWGTQKDFISEARDIGNAGRREATVMIGSIDAGLAGYHVDVMKFSDIVEENNVKTPQQIDTVIKTFGMCENLLVRPDSWQDVEGTIYDSSDLYSQTIKAEAKRKKEGKPPKWVIHVRGVYKKDTGDKEPQFTPEELELPYLRDEKGQKISWWPERWTVEALEERRTDPTVGEYLFACTPGDAPILMSDWTEKPIAQVAVGNKIIGFKRPLQEDGSEGRPVLVEAEVIDKGYQLQQVFEYTLESGATVRSTADHLWWNGRKISDNDSHNEYYTPKVGRNLVKVYDIPEYSAFQKEELRWLAGFIDADGRVQSNGIIITQSNKVNGHICRRLEDCFANLGIKYHTWTRKEQDTNYYVLNGGRNLRVQLSRLRMAKHKAIVDGLWQHSGRVGTKDKIVSVRSLGVQTVFWLTTTTGNYISQGFASKNCQQLLNPIGVEDESQTFPVNKDFPKWISKKNFRMNVRVVYRTMTVDTAETNNQRSNKSAITVVAWDQYGRAYVEEIRAGKWLPDELISQLFAAYLLHHPTTVMIEETSFVRGLMASINRTMQTRNIYLPLTFIKRETTISKKERITNTLQPWYRGGDLRFLDDLDHKEELIEELRRFPRYSEDDIIDSLADHFQNKTWFGREQGRSQINPFDSKTTAEERVKVMRDNLEKALNIEPWNPNEPNMLIPVPGNSFYDKTGGL